MKTAQLPQEYAIILQEVAETGEEDLIMLEESVNFDHQRLMHILNVLKHKGLIRFSSSQTYSDAWISLSGKGRRFVQAMWPDMRLRPHLSV